MLLELPLFLELALLLELLEFVLLVDGTIPSDGGSSRLGVLALEELLGGRTQLLVLGTGVDARRGEQVHVLVGFVEDWVLLGGSVVLVV